MEKMTVNITPVTIDPPAVKYAPVVPIAGEKNSTSTSISSETKTLSPDQINISKEAHKKNVDEKNQAAMQKISGNESTEETEESSGEDELDQMIAELQEKIAELSQRIASIRSKGDEASIEKAKSLESELAMLNGQLMELLNQKMESAKNES